MNVASHAAKSSTTQNLVRDLVRLHIQEEWRNHAHGLLSVDVTLLIQHNAAAVSIKAATAQIINSHIPNALR